MGSFLLKITILSVSMILTSCFDSTDQTAIDFESYANNSGYSYEYVDESGNYSLYVFEDVNLNGYDLLQQSEYDEYWGEWTIAYGVVDYNKVYHYGQTQGSLVLILELFDEATYVTPGGAQITPYYQTYPVQDLAGTVLSNCDDLVRIETHSEYVSPYDGSISETVVTSYSARNIGKIYSTSVDIYYSGPNSPGVVLYTETSLLQSVRVTSTQADLDITNLCS